MYDSKHDQRMISDMIMHDKPGDQCMINYVISPGEIKLLAPHRKPEVGQLDLEAGQWASSACAPKPSATSFIK